MDFKYILKIRVLIINFSFYKIIDCIIYCDNLILGDDENEKSFLFSNCSSGFYEY